MKTSSQQRKVGDKVMVRLDVHRILGDLYFGLSGKVGIISSVDSPDDDGEQVFGVRFGREHRTITETMLS